MEKQSDNCIEHQYYSYFKKIEVYYTLVKEVYLILYLLTLFTLLC